MRIGITGTQHGPSESQKREFELLFESYTNVTEVHHGACIGVDEWVHDYISHLCIGHNKKIKIIVHPPVITKKMMPEFKFALDFVTVLEARDYLGRNKDIVRSCDTMIAIPKTPWEEWRSGTWSTFRYAQHIKTPVVLIVPKLRTKLVQFPTGVTDGKS